MGLDVPRLIIVSFLLSGMFVGFAAATEILGVKGYVRADWNPAFGLWVVPLVFLARLNAIGVIPYVVLLALVSIGGDFAAQNAGLTSKFTAPARRPDAALHGADGVVRAPGRAGWQLPAGQHGQAEAGRRVSTIVAASGAFSDAGLTALLSGAILVCVPLLFAALGELVSERSGVLNIGLEGMMLMGRTPASSPPTTAATSGTASAPACSPAPASSLFMVLFCVRLGLDQIVVGIAITLTCEGVTALIFEAEFAESRPTLGAVDRLAIPWLSDLPVVGGRGESNGSVFTQPLVVYLGLGLVVLVAWILRRTHAGLNIRAAGDTPGALDAAGVSVFATRSCGRALRRGDGRARRRLHLDRGARASFRTRSSAGGDSSPSSSQCSPAAVRCGS